MNQTSLIVIVVVALIAIAIIVIRKRKTGTATGAAGAGTAIDQAVSELKAHVEKTVNAAADAIKTRVATVGNVVVDKLGGEKAPAARSGAPQATHVAQDSAAVASASPGATSAASTAPAAPAASVAADPPPTAQPAATPAVLAPSVGGGGTADYPQVIAIDGVHLLVDAPINPNWKIDDETRAYDSPTSYLGEPSNGGKCKPPQPLRSPAGYPLFYALGAGNAPVGAPRVLYGDTSYPDDAAVAAAIAAKASDDAAHAIAAAAAANQVFAGPVPVSVLTHADLQFLWWATINPATPKMHNWEYTVLSGSRAAIQQAMATIGNNVAQMHGYDAAKYNGVLRSYYDAAVKA